MSIHHHLQKLHAVAQLQVLEQIGLSKWDGSNAGSIFIILSECDLLQLCEWVRVIVYLIVRVFGPNLNHDVRLLIKGY